MVQRIMEIQVWFVFESFGANQTVQSTHRLYFKFFMIVEGRLGEIEMPDDSGSCCQALEITQRRDAHPVLSVGTQWEQKHADK